MRKRLFSDMDNGLVDLQSGLNRIDEGIKANYRAKRLLDKDRLEEIPVILREILGKDFEPSDVLGYKYAAGYWAEDESSWDCPIRDFIEDPLWATHNVPWLIHPLSPPNSHTLTFP